MDNDACSPYFRPQSHSSHNHESYPPSNIKPEAIPPEVLREWQTPHMPLLTSRQLELTLLEIQRRQRQRQRQSHRQQQQTTSQPSTQQQIDTNNTLPSNKKEAAVLVPICTVEGTPSILFTRRSAKLSTHASQISFPGGYFDEALDGINDGFNVDVGNCDARLVNAAVREMQEELCYNLDGLGIGYHFKYCKGETSYQGDTKQHIAGTVPFISILGQTQPVPSMHGSFVTPIIGSINYDLPHFASDEFKSIFKGNPEEVDWIFTVPIQDLISSETSEPLKKWGDQDLASTKGRYEFYGPVYPVPECDGRKKEGDRIWGLTASVLRPLLQKVIKPVFEKTMQLPRCDSEMLCY